MFLQTRWCLEFLVVKHDLTFFFWPFHHLIKCDHRVKAMSTVKSNYIYTIQKKILKVQFTPLYLSSSKISINVNPKILDDILNPDK